MKVGEKLEQVREGLGWSKMTMARYLELTQTGYNRVTSGTKFSRGRTFRDGNGYLPQRTLNILYTLTGKNEDYWVDEE